jgi:serine/threonine-protein kinase
MDDQLEKLRTALEGRYEIERILGAGGMAVVYLAKDVRHDRRVAIKVLRSDLAASLGADRFLREIRFTAKLNHPHVLPLHESGEADGLLYYVMPFVIGESLRDLLNRERQLPIDDALRIAREVAEALAYAHGQGLVHRDVKPENVLLSEGHAIVADFGISRAVSEAGGAALTHTGLAIGTPAYMSPEQSAADPGVDARSDIYSLGCILYEMLVGQIPFPAPTAQAMMARHTVEPVPSPSVMRPAIPVELEEIIVCALDKNPADRFQTAAEFGAALAAVEKGDVPRIRTRAQRSPRAPHVALRRALYPAIGVVVLAVGGVLGWQLAAGRRTGRPNADGAAGKAQVTSIAVLPFDNDSDDPSNEYFGEGLATELIDALAGIEGIRVAARQSTWALNAEGATPQTIGRELNVRAILEGSVRKTGAQVRISARLIDAGEGFQLWSDRYDRTVDDVFVVQSEIARSMVAALRAELGSTGEALAGEPPTREPMAYDKYLWGQFNLNRRTEEGAKDAINNFTMAVGFDSLFASAYAGLADAHLALLDVSAEARNHQTLDSARAAAETALRLNPALARARVSLGSVEFKTFNWRAAEAEYVRALEASPDDPIVRQRYAELLASLGRVDDALVHARVAVERDKLSPSAWHTLLKVLRVNGGYPEAIRAGQEILKLNVNEVHPWLDIGLLFLLEGRPADATDALERYAELRGGDPAQFRAVAAAAARFAGDGSAARLPPEVAIVLLGSPVDLAVLHQLVGDGQEALSVLENAHRAGHPDLTTLTMRPELAPLRQHPRMRVILVDLGRVSR